ncbi:hypothetical protein Tco_1171887 [Tanacetum coccineum]
MEELATNDKANYYSGITSIMNNGKRDYELKGKFLDDLHKNAFSGTNGDDAVEHMEYFIKIVDPINLPNVNYERLRMTETNTKWDPTNVEFEEWLISTFAKQMMMDPFTKNVDPELFTYDIESTMNYKDYENRLNNESEEPVNDQECSPFANWRNYIRGPYANYYSNFLDKKERENEERCELFDDQEWSVCIVRRFEMIIYSFGDDEEYVAVK